MIYEDRIRIHMIHESHVTASTQILTDRGPRTMLHSYGDFCALRRPITSLSLDDCYILPLHTMSSIVDIEVARVDIEVTRVIHRIYHASGCEETQ